MADKKRSYLNPKFEFDTGDISGSASWNWDLLKRKVKKHFNQKAAHKEYVKNNPKKKGLNTNSNTRSLLDQIED